ncbi:MAG: hypothetical protein AAGM84_14955 [Pseudomonadota bacterium]
MELALILIPIAVAVGFGIMGWKTVMRRAAVLFGVTLALTMIGNIGLWVATDNAQGWDGIGYFLIMIGTSLPATLGLLIGGGLALMFRGRLNVPS